MKRERRDVKKIYDVFNGLVEVDRLEYAPDNREKAEIKRILKMGFHQPFPRCNNKDTKTARILDLELGFTREQQAANLGVHTKKGHVCADCRCKRVAGIHTRGWWYWPEDNKSGLREVGHYGVGKCYKHGPHNVEAWNGNSLAVYRESIIREIEAMQQMGSSADTCGGYMVRFDNTVKGAEIRNDIRATLETMKVEAEAFAASLERDQLGQREFIDGLTELYDGEKGEKFEELVWDYVQKKTPLTESGGRGKAMPMTDDTKFKWKLNWLNGIAKVAKSDFDVSKGDFAHADEITIMMKRFMTAVEMIFKPKGTQEDWDKLGVEIKGILCSMRSAEGSILFREMII